MIVTVLLTVVFGVLNAVFSLIPDFDTGLDGARTTDGALIDNAAVAYVVWTWKTLDLFFPVSTVLIVIAALLATKLFVAMAQFIRWVWSVIPAKGT